MQAWLATPGERLVGTIVAVAIASLWLPLTIPGLTRKPATNVLAYDPFTLAFLTVVPVVAVLAFLITPLLLRWSRRRAVVVTAILVVAVNALVVGEIMTTAGQSQTIGVDRAQWLINALLVGGPVAALFGLLFYGLPALIPSFMSALVWHSAMRWIFPLAVRADEAPTDA